MSTLELIQYYVGLLILQYTGKPKAEGTIAQLATMVVMPQTSVQVLAFSAVPDSGSFVLSYGGVPTLPIDWNDNAATVQAELQTIPGLSSVTVTGDFTAGFTVIFTGVAPVAQLLVVDSSTLQLLSVDVATTVTETDDTLPLAVQNGFNLIAPGIAVGAQLDTIGDYAGVTRTGPGFTQQITLTDADFLLLIQMAIVQNSAGSSLAEIQGFIAQFFAGSMLVFDYKNMRMSYLIDSDFGSQDLIQLFVTEGLLPRPMAVQLASVIYAPIITTFFGFRTYYAAAFNASPFNDYAAYQTDYPWLSYANAVYA